MWLSSWYETKQVAGHVGRLFLAPVSVLSSKTHANINKHTGISSQPVSHAPAVRIPHTQPNCEWWWAELLYWLWPAVSGRERSNPSGHHTARGGRKHTGKKRKLDISDEATNISQCNVTNWSEHAGHLILTSDFEAALIFETHLEEAKLMTAVKKARKSAWAGTSRAAIGTAINGTNAEFSPWFANDGTPNTCPLVQAKPVFSVPTYNWRKGSWAGKFCCSLPISSIWWVFAVKLVPF